MRIGRATYADHVFYGVIEGDTITEIIGDIYHDFSVTDTSHNLAEVKLLAPIDPVLVIAIGLNYRKHAKESGLDYPTEPVIFLKATSSVIGPNEPIQLPKRHPDEVDYEVEMAIVIGKTAKDVPETTALDYVLGYTCSNDISARDCQLRLDVQWARGKSFDTFCPIGPWIETDLDPDQQPICSRLNGVLMQESNTADMIFSTAQLVSYCSQNMTLHPGTIIMTGTPEGVGVAKTPPVFMQSGDLIEIEVGGIGRLNNPVIA